MIIGCRFFFMLVLNRYIPMKAYQTFALNEIEVTPVPEYKQALSIFFHPGNVVFFSASIRTV